MILTRSPSYPFKKVCADYFQIQGYSYLSVVDCFSGWLCRYSFKDSEVHSHKLPQVLHDLLIAYGVPKEFGSDGGPHFMSKDFQEFLKLWVVRNQLLSVAYPQSNGRAELGVKAAKRTIYNNLS